MGIALPVDHSIANGEMFGAAITLSQASPLTKRSISFHRQREDAHEADQGFSSPQKEAVRISAISPADESGQGIQIPATVRALMQQKGFKPIDQKATNNRGNANSIEDVASLLGANLKHGVQINHQSMKKLGGAVEKLGKHSNGHSGSHTDHVISAKGPGKSGPGIG